MDMITVRPQEGGVIDIRLRRHELRMEKSPGEGGGDRAPSPVEMAVAALGACIGLMVDDYCRRGGYGSGGVAVYLAFQMGGSPKRIESIAVDLEIPADVPEEKREAILRIAQHCPVHQSFQLPPAIEIEIVSPRND